MYELSVCLCVCMYVCMYVCVYMYACMYACMYVCIYLYFRMSSMYDYMFVAYSNYNHEFLTNLALSVTLFFLQDLKCEIARTRLLISILLPPQQSEPAESKLLYPKYHQKVNDLFP